MSSDTGRPGDDSAKTCVAGGSGTKTPTKRLAHAVELLCDGTLTRGEIAAAIVSKYGVTLSTAYRTIKKAREEVLPAWHELGEQKVLVAETVAKAIRHYRRCVNGDPPNYGAGLATLKWIAELQGIAPITKVEVSGKLEVALTKERIDDLRGMFGLPPRAEPEPADDDG